MYSDEVSIDCPVFALGSAAGIAGGESGGIALIALIAFDASGEVVAGWCARKTGLAAAGLRSGLAGFDVFDRVVGIKGLGICIESPVTVELSGAEGIVWRGVDGAKSLSLGKFAWSIGFVAGVLNGEFGALSTFDAFDAVSSTGRERGCGRPLNCEFVEDW